MPQITTIITRLPPPIDGVGDYGLKVALELRNHHDLDTKFIVGDPTWAGEAFVNGFEVEKVRERNSQSLIKALDSSEAVLLHYVGHGYARRGCPTWLIEGLETWYKKFPNADLVTMFHELYANGTIWSSAFWTSPLQQSLFKRLVKLSDRAITSREEYKIKISQVIPSKHDQVDQLPVFSNVGELSQPIPLRQRQRRLVIFGSAGWRCHAYRRSLCHLERVCRDLEITEIIDIGSGVGFDLPLVNQIMVTAVGVRSAEEISQYLAGAIAGFLDYPTEFLGKSGIFAAYCAYGVLPVGVFYPNQRQLDGLEVGKHLLLADRYEGKIDLEVAEAIANHAYSWYQTHNLSVHGKVFAAKLKLTL
jgi:hypothetical protein